MRHTLAPLSFDWDGQALLGGMPCRWFRISPRRIQAWREVNEVRNRELMRTAAAWPDASAGAPRDRGRTGPRTEATESRT